MSSHTTCFKCCMEAAFLYHFLFQVKMSNFNRFLTPPPQILTDPSKASVSTILPDTPHS